MQFNHSSFAGPRAFARHMLATGFPMHPFIGGMRTAPEGHPGGRAMEGILFREGPWQILLLVMPPNCTVQKHRHGRFASAELSLGGGGTAFVANRVYVAPEVRRGSVDANVVCLARGEWHEGFAGPNGSIFLSFQQWFDGPPAFISDDWEAASDY